MRTRKYLSSLLLAASIATGSAAAASAQSLDTSDPAVKAQLDAYIQSWVQQHGGEIFNSMQAHIAAEEEASRPKLADFQAKIDQLLALDSPREGADPANAKVFVIEFFDYNCPFCLGLHGEIRALQKDPAMKDVAYIYRDYPILESQTHSSVAAAEAVRAADAQGKFSAYADLVWTLPSHKITEQMLIDKAVEAGLDMKAFNEFRSRESTRKSIDDSLALGQSLRIAGTPFSLLWSPANKQGALINGYVDAAKMKAAITALKNGEPLPE